MREVASSELQLMIEPSMQAEHIYHQDQLVYTESWENGRVGLYVEELLENVKYRLRTDPRRDVGVMRDKDFEEKELRPKAFD